MKSLSMACILVLVAIGRAETPPAPVDFDHAFSAGASGPGLAPGDAMTPPIPEIRVKTVVVVPADPEETEARAPAAGTRSKLEVTRR